MKIASFNVRRFGLSKVADPDVLSTLVKIVSRYDIILILEVVDASGDSVKLFMQKLERVNTSHHYSLQVSTRLGRNRYKEQFLFLYRDDVVKFLDAYQYEDNQVNDMDVFAREPYILHFRPHYAVLKDLVLIPVHTTPSESEKELDELYEVFLHVRDKWKTDTEVKDFMIKWQPVLMSPNWRFTDVTRNQAPIGRYQLSITLNIMILGDFNADGTYVTHKEMKEIRIRSDTNFHWLIGDDVDTTANTSNDHTYDRIVVYGDDMLAAVVPNSAKPFNFHAEFSMTEEMALRVSDHYPVEVELHSVLPPCMIKSIVDTQNAPGNKTITESLQADVLKLQRENLLLVQEKLQLQISLLKRKLAKMELGE